MGDDTLPEDVSGKTCDFDVCTECKVSCCIDAKPPLTSERRKIIKNYLKEQGIEIKNPFAKAGYSYPAVDALGFCVFYDKATKRCVIHPVKPETCKAGPITFDINRSSGMVEWFLKKDAICIFAPRLHRNDDKFREHFEAAKSEITHLICSLDAAALLAILQVDEPDTFKLGEDALPKEAAAKLNAATKRK
jgi:Fe-S-cluster containining protein